jgi:hypothetical protein
LKIHEKIPALLPSPNYNEARKESPPTAQTATLDFPFSAALFRLVENK